jgi:hypothetical protein
MLDASWPWALREFQLGRLLGQELGHLLDVGDARHHVEALATAVALAPQRLAHDHRIEGRDERAHGQAVDRRRGDQRQLAHTRQRQLQGARDRRGGQRQHMHVLAQLLQALLVRDAEVLLLVDDQQAEPLEGDRLAEQRVRADRDVDGAVADAGLDAASSLAADQARGLADAARQPLKRCEKVAKCWRASSVVGTTTPPGSRQRGDEGARSATSVLPKPTSPHTSRSIGLPEARSSSTVWMLAPGRRSRRTGSGRRTPRRRRAAGAMLGAWRSCLQRGDLDQLGGDLAQALLEAGLARLPAGPPSRSSCVPDSASRSASAARCSRPAGRACRHPHSRSRGSRAGTERRDGGEPVEAADAMIGMDHEVADAEAGRFRDDVGGARALRRGRTSRSPRISCSAITAMPGASKPCSSRARRAPPSAGSAGARVAVDLRASASLCSASSVASRSRAHRGEGGDHTRRPALQARTWPAGVEHVEALAAALGREVAPTPAETSAHPARGTSPARTASCAARCARLRSRPISSRGGTWRGGTGCRAAPRM